MAIFSEYSSGQRIGFALVSIGFILCFIGSISPYWITTDVNTTSLVSMYVGVWWYCVDTFTETECFNFYTPNDGYDSSSPDGDRFAWINLVRVGVVFNGVLGFICMVAACCRGMCCSGGRTICHGIFAFCAAVCGFIAVGIFSSKTNRLTSISVVDFSYDWAYGIYICGTIMMGISSLLLCCSPPRQHNTGMVLMGAPGGVNVSVNQSTVSQYNAPVPMYQPINYPVSQGDVALHNSAYNPNPANNQYPNPANNQYLPGAAQQPPVYAYNQAEGPDPFAKN